MNIITIPSLADLQGSWKELRILLNGIETVIPDVYPFMSVTELKRRIWMQQSGDPRWEPERVFLGIQDSTNEHQLRPLEFYWSNDSPTIRDPRFAELVPNPLLVDEAGNRKPVHPKWIGSLLLELNIDPSRDVLVAVTLASIVPDTISDSMTAEIYHGFFQYYFPWLTAPSQVLDAGSSVMSSGLKETYAVTVPFLEDRTGRISLAQKSIQRIASVNPPKMEMTTMIRMRWLLPTPLSRPDSLEKTFYGLKATPLIPFLRYFPPEGTGAPLLKLALNSDGTPVLVNPKVLASFLNQPAPNFKSGVIVARIPLTTSGSSEGKGFAMTAHLFDDGTSDITLEVPQRGTTFPATVVLDSLHLLRNVMTAMGYPEEITPILRDLFATYKFTVTSSTALTPARIRSRMAVLTPFLEEVPVLADETALAAFQWKAVSNYESESAQFAFITQLILRAEKNGTAGKTPAEAYSFYKREISKQFGITEQKAAELLERAIEKREEAVAPGTAKTDGIKAVPVHAIGAHVSLSGTHPDYSIEIHGVSSFIELQRIITIVGIILGGTTEDLLIAPPSSKAVSLLSKAISIEDKRVEEKTIRTAAAGAASLPIMIPEEEEADDGVLNVGMDDLLQELGFGGSGNIDEEVGETDEIPPPPPPKKISSSSNSDSSDSSSSNSDSSDSSESACRANPWTDGEPALKIKKEWYMARLKKEDKTLFGYTVSRKGGTRSQVASYSKSCQRQDDRQPNIMTQAEYNRVRRCYEGRVKFVNLPPKTPEDLPFDPSYNPKKKVPEEYFLRDPQTGKPMWTVYNYENKTTPGQTMYLMCAELWCDRDNLPLLRSEFESTQGRGFSKPAKSCPFCGGKVIVKLDSPIPGESIILRLPKKNGTRIHAFIGTIAHNKHPDGHPLPCCDLTPRMLKNYMAAAHTGTLVYGKDLAAAGADDASEIDGVLSEKQLTIPSLLTAIPEEGALTDYTQKMATIRTQYILGVDKALSAGKIGLLSPELDAFFGQNGPASLESRGIRPTFREGSTLFVRLGVDVRTNAPGLNLFAGLAPVLGYQSAEEMQRAFLSMNAVRAFESANYGTLLHEFAAREPSSPSKLFEKTLAEFATEYKYPLETARPHVSRVYRAWSTFLAYINNPREPKKLRHFEHLIAQPGIITPRGLLLLVLEKKDDKIHIVCPSFGIPPSSDFGDVPVAILWHDTKYEVWEPLILYNDSRFAGTRNAIYLFGERSPDLEALPKVMRAQLAAWIREWRSSSKGCGRGVPPPHVWTPDRDTAGLPRLRQLLAKTVKALVRDRSNRLAGVLTPYFIPCLDDGSLANDIPRVYEASMIPALPLSEYLKTYATLSATYSMLKPIKLVANLDLDRPEIIGFQIAAGSYIPTMPEAIMASPPLPIQQVDEFPWERDGLILRSPDTSTFSISVRDESLASIEEQISEAYQHVRLSFGQWMQQNELGLTLQKELSRVINSNLPLFERRKRLDIMLEPFIRELIAVEPVTAADEHKRKSLAILRQDCISLPEVGCKQTGACRWGGDRCLIHAPATSAVDPVRIFTARLSDELLRNITARKELFTGSVPELRPPRGIVRIGNELIMATKQRDTATTIMDRLGFTGVTELSFPEEMMRFEGPSKEEEAAEAIVSLSRGIGARLVDYSDDSIPFSWSALGFVLPKPIDLLPNPHLAAFFSATGRGITEWSAVVQSFAIRGDTTTPFNWSMRDFYLIAQRLRLNILFIEDGQIRVWLRPNSPPFGTVLFWGPKQFILTNGKKWFFPDKELPVELLQLMDATTPTDPTMIIESEPTKVYAAGAASKP